MHKYNSSIRYRGLSNRIVRNCHRLRFVECNGLIELLLFIIRLRFIARENCSPWIELLIITMPVKLHVPAHIFHAVRGVVPAKSEIPSRHGAVAQLTLHIALLIVNRSR